MKSLLQLVLGVLVAFILPFPSIASEDISSSVNINYLIQEDGSNRVDHQITLTNNTSSSYVTQYSLELNSNRIQNISITDQHGKPIPFSQQSTDVSTILLLEFSDPVVGKDKSRIINLKYQNPDISTFQGNILEINIPQLNNKDQYNSFTTNVIVPNNFDQPSLISPSTYQKKSDDTITTISFDKSQLHSGAIILFGQEQHYSVQAGIELTNQSITPVETQIALPPDTTYQKVYLNSLSPLPQSLTQDSDGNWIATYIIQAKQSIPIKVDQTITVYNQPRHPVVVDNVDLNQLITENQYWETSSEAVKNIAGKYPTISEIYSYLVENFKYNYARIDNQSTHRLGAKQAISNPDNALCLEFSDSFIAISRANNIPSRLLTGFAYTQNPGLKPLSLVQNSLHAWPEYLDMNTNTWKSADPTWGHTTKGIDYLNNFDFNHITFAINGNESENPHPIGYDSTSTNALAVNFSTSKPEEMINNSFKIHVPPTTLLGFSDSVEITIINASNIALYGQELKLYHQQNELVGKTTINSSIPLSETTYQIKLSSPYTNLGNVITIEFYGQEQNIEIIQIPGIAGAIFFAFATTTAIGFSIYLYKTRRVLVSGEK